MTLAKDYRLKGKKEFNRVKGKGKLTEGPFFSLLVLDKQEKNGPKFGFIVSKKIDKRAVERNRIRRLLARAAREILPEARKDVRVIFLVKKRIKEAGLNEVLESLRRKLGEYAEKR